MQRVLLPATLDGSEDASLFDGLLISVTFGHTALIVGQKERWYEKPVLAGLETETGSRNSGLL